MAAVSVYPGEEFGTLNILISLSSCVSEGLSVNDACRISRSRPVGGER